MSLYMNTDKPAMGSRIRPSTSKDNIGGGAGQDKLNKRVAANAKFAHVKSTLNTGANAGNVKVKVDRSGEMFRRVNRRQLHQLMMACESGDESIYRLQERWDSVDDNDDAASTRSGMSARSHSSNASYASASSSTGTIIATHTSSTGSAAAASCPASCASDYFILLDVRDDEAQFKAFHIEGSIHYPPSCLRRDFFPPALYRFKNAADKLIILVDSDESSRIGLECATLFLQKGFANIFVLTGGLKHFGAKYGDRIVGEALQPPQSAQGQQQRASMGAGAGAGVGAGGVSNRSQALAGMPASSRPFTGASAASAASARPSSSASARMHQQQQSQQQQQSSRPGAGTSLQFSSGAAAPASRPGATQLGGGGFGSSRFHMEEDRESPRAALGRTQQQQQQQSGGSSSSSAPSHRSRLSNGSAAGTAGVATGGHAQISSRAFR